MLYCWEPKFVLHCVWGLLILWSLKTWLLLTFTLGFPIHGDWDVGLCPVSPGWRINVWVRNVLLPQGTETHVAQNEDVTWMSSSLGCVTQWYYSTTLSWLSYFCVCKTVSLGGTAEILLLQLKEATLLGCGCCFSSFTLFFFFFNFFWFCRWVKSHSKVYFSLQYSFMISILVLFRIDRY